MKQLACLALFTYLFLAGFSVSSRAQYCYYDVAGGPCVGGECNCWSVTAYCGTFMCGAQGGSCDYGDVTISWSTQVTCQ